MKVYKTGKGIVIEQDQKFYLSAHKNWNDFINRQHLYNCIAEEIKNSPDDTSLNSALEKELLAPIQDQEIWAAGVTYMRSKEARMEEAKDAGSSDFYARVYEAQRPELFFKATASRAVGCGADVRIRKDSNWNVPEPELTLFICSAGTIEGYTIGNDMSSRDIEGENPLYLPQAKTYDASAAIGPCLYISPSPIDADTLIRIIIYRDGTVVFKGEVSINRMKRTHIELASYLFRATSFPCGVYLMTGTGIVPPDDFTLQPGDEIHITMMELGH